MATLAARLTVCSERVNESGSQWPSNKGTAGSSNVCNHPVHGKSDVTEVRRHAAETTKKKHTRLATTGLSVTRPTSMRTHERASQEERKEKTTDRRKSSGRGRREINTFHLRILHLKLHRRTPTRYLLALIRFSSRVPTSKEPKKVRLVSKGEKK